MGLELPEVLTIAQQMNKELKGKKIKNALLKNYDSLLKMGFIKSKPRELEVRLVKKSINSICGEGKWLFMQLKPEMQLVLGEILGKILFHKTKDSIPPKYNLLLEFEDNTLLTVIIYFYGFIMAVTHEELKQLKYPGKLGISPLAKKFTLPKFNDILEESSKEIIKAVLLDQKKIAGIGNSYLQDILFRAKIHPKRKVGDISIEERKILFNAITKTLKEALRLGGRNNEFDLYNKPGGYKPILDKNIKGKPCPECGKKIEKLNILGSTCYVCANCQK
ncbi:MAG: Fpg/Nei family DNA glycosylase [candidate division WOR-3 bacterium]|nr:Fpg/Nei family DNA glycosylase [candidate division WOR-3 bacterium]